MNEIPGEFSTTQKDLDLHRTLDSYSYDELASLTHLQLEAMQRQAASLDLRWYRVTKSIVTGRPVGRFRKLFTRTTRLEKAFCEFFLLSRIRTLAVSYLGVREASDFSPTKPENRFHLPHILNICLLELGKSLRIRFVVRVLSRNLAFTADPFAHLRAIYFYCVKSHREGSRGFRDRFKYSLLLAMHGAALRAKFMALHLVVRVYRKKLLKRFAQSPDSWIFEENIQRYMRLGICFLFPSSAKLGRGDWAFIQQECSDFLATRLKKFFEVIPLYSLHDDGLIKLFKVAIGTLLGRASQLRVGEAATKEYITDSVKLAYCWGITYPLIDNVLDSDSISDEDRLALHAVLVSVFRSDGSDLTVANELANRISPIAVELVRCFEVLITILGDRWERSRKILELLLESHLRDSRRRLDSINGSDSEWRDVWADTVLKAALIRWATMDICGIEVDSELLRSGIRTAPFNQLGDDMFDIVDDSRENRVTPFTLDVKYRRSPSPGSLFLAVADNVARASSRLQRKATYLCVSEVIAKSYFSGNLPEDVSFALQQEDHDFPEALSSVIWVDLDDALFEFGRIFHDFAAKDLEHYMASCRA